jgi:S-adenosylmethionine-diacylglycerol 3-amino-3-carboxypropyl transferase
LLKKFYERLSYSFGNEDCSTELKALDIQKNDHVVCITASGDRPLNLMSQDLEKIYAVDLNPIQNHLLRLKITALEQLDYPDYLNFLGATEEAYPVAFLDSILEELPSESKDFWLMHLGLIEKGILYQGALEKLCFSISIILQLFFKKEIEKLFSADNLLEQELLIDQLFDRKLFKFLSKIILNSWIAKKYFSDPGLYEFVDKKVKVSDYIISQIKNSLQHHLIKENPLLHLLFYGKVESKAFPPYLQKEGVSKIKKNLTKVEIIHLNMVDFLKKLEDNSIDCFSFSDIASYMNQKDFNLLLKEMIRVGRPNARFCIRELMSRHAIDPENESQLFIDHELSEELKMTDNCFVYRFLAGKIK